MCIYCYIYICYFDQPLFVAFTQIGIPKRNSAPVNHAKRANVQNRWIYFISVPCGLWTFRNHKFRWVYVFPSHIYILYIAIYIYYIIYIVYSHSFTNLLLTLWVIPSSKERKNGLLCCFSHDHFFQISPSLVAHVRIPQFAIEEGNHACSALLNFTN